MGISIWNVIAVENAPEVNLPGLSISYSFSGASPEVVERELTRKVEGVVSRLRGVTEIRSNSRTGGATISVEFTKNTPVDYRVLELREYLFAIEQDLPNSVRPATITRHIPEEIREEETFILYTLSGDFNLRDLLSYGEKNIKHELAGMQGLAEIKLHGVEPPALVVEFDQTLIERYNINPGEIMRGISRKLSWQATGYVDNDKYRLSLVVPPEFKSVFQIEQFEIPIEKSLRVLQLSDIAKVSIQDAPASSIRRLNGNPSLTIEFVKETGADAFVLAEEIRLHMSDISALLPSNMELRLQRDSTEELRQQFDDLQVQAIYSAILVFFVVLLFIRTFRAPIVIIGSILFSSLLSVTTLYLVGYSLNVLTLAGLTVSLGMLIDNAVVVFEQVNPGLPSHRKDRIQHIKEHLPRAFVPVLGSTFTTIGIFIPLLFALENLRVFLLPLAIALTLTLISSVIIAFTWIPYSLIWLTPNTKKKKKKRGKKFNTDRFVLRTLVWKGKFRWVFLILVIATVGIPIFKIETPDWEDESNLWPEFTKAYFDNRDEIDAWIGGLAYRFANETYFGNPWRGNNDETIFISIRSPEGTPLSEIDKIAKNFEKLAEPYAHAFKYYEAQLREGGGRSTIEFVIKPEYLYSEAGEPFRYFSEAGYLAAQTGNVWVSVSAFGTSYGSSGFGGGSSSHRITLTGYSYQELLDLAGDFERRLKKNRRVTEVDISGTGFSNSDFHQFKLEIDEDELAAKGLVRQNIINAISLDVNPENTNGRVDFQGREMSLISRTIGEDKYEEDLFSKSRSENGKNFKLSEIARIGKEKNIANIRRLNQAYERVVTAKFLGPYRLGAEYIQGVIDETPVPIGTEVKFGFSGFNFRDRADRNNLLFVGLLSILSVWMIVAALLESVKGPLFVISAVPFSMIGIMLGTLTNDLAFDRGAIAGALLCIGVVVNNAILIFHEKQLQAKQGRYGLRALYYTYQNKMRAILITTVTTISGLLPMTIFGNSELWENLAIIVIWGLSFSTILLLLFSGLWIKKRV